AGVFQDVPITPGVAYTYSGFHQSSDPNPNGYVTEVRIEWRSSAGGGSEISRNQILPIAAPSYSPFSETATAPAGADTARVLYQIQTITNTGPLMSGEVFVDDLSLTVAPEPGSLALLGAAIALGASRRRRGLRAV